MNNTPAYTSKFSQRPWPHLLREWRALVGVAYPIVLSQLAQVAMGFVDTLMAGRVSPDDLAAVAIGFSLWLPLFLLCGGILMALTPLGAHACGANDSRGVGALVRQGLWLALLLGCAGAFLLTQGVEVMLLMGADQNVISIAKGYLQGVAWGFPAAIIFCALRSYSESLSLTRPIMVTSLVGLAINIPLNYLLIYGYGWIPAFGGAGCGYATGVVMWISMAVMIGITRWSPRYQSTSPWQWGWPSLRSMGTIVQLGLPIGIAVFIETTIFAVVALLLVPLGSVVVAGHQIALNFASVLFTLPYSIGCAMTVRIGNALGAGEHIEARFRAFAGMILSSSGALVSGTLTLVGAATIAALYSPDSAVREVATTLLVFAALFQLSDATQLAAAGALRGYKDTRVPMFITVLAYWIIGLPLGMILGVTSWWREPLGASGLWIGLTAGLSCAAVLLTLRLYRIANHKGNVSHSGNTTIYFKEDR
ncbi:MATE family efflux transporter [Chrysiogenes arsenatis]|uniref:MATE family efflux transporter n=1 Tax=Chrysiogenes arsenatis TaxID=309797 RepID=UPI00191C3A4F|nr:MATE family efflux transporter [Chrysiogenes arsenatis]